MLSVLALIILMGLSWEPITPSVNHYKLKSSLYDVAGPVIIRPRKLWTRHAFRVSGAPAKTLVPNDFCDLL